MPKSFIYFVRNYGSRMPFDVDDEEIDENETPQSNVMPTKMTTRSVSQQGKPLDDFRLPWKPSSKTSGIGRGHVKDRRREIKSPSYHHLSLMTRIRSEKHGSRQASSSHPNKTATTTSNTTSNNTNCSSEDSLLDSHSKGGKDKTDAQNNAGCSTEDSKAKAQTVKSSVTNLLRSKLVSGGIRKSSSVDPGKGRSISSGVGTSSAGRSRSVVIMRRSATLEDFGKTSSAKTVSSTASQATAHTARKSGLNCRTSSPKCQVIAKKVMRKSPVAVLTLDKSKSEQVKHRKAGDLVYSIENGRGKIVHRKLDLDRSVRSSGSSANSNHAAITLGKFPFQNRTSIVDLNDDKENHSLLGLKRGFPQTLHFNDNKVSDATKQSKPSVPQSLPSITDIATKRRRIEGQNDSHVICSVAGKPAVTSREQLTSTHSLKTGILNRFTLRPFLSQHFLTRHENINKQNESITLGKENVINVSKQWCLQSEQPRFFLDKTSDEISLSSRNITRRRSLSEDKHSGIERGLLEAGVRSASRNKDVAELSKPTTGTHRTIVYPSSASAADKISQLIVGKRLTETLPFDQGSSFINTESGCHSVVRDDLRSTPKKLTHILQNESRPGGLVLSKQYLESFEKTGSRPLLDNITRQVRVATLGNNTPVFVCTGPIRTQSSQRHFAEELSASSSVSSQSLANVKIDSRSMNIYPMKNQTVPFGTGNPQNSNNLASDRVATCLTAQGIRADSIEMDSKSNVIIPIADSLRLSVQSGIGSANTTPDSSGKQARLPNKQDFINRETQASFQNSRNESEGSHIRSEARPLENLQEMFPKPGHGGNFLQADKMLRHFATAMNSSANIICGDGFNTLRNSGETKAFVDNIHSGQPQSCPPLGMPFPFDIMRATVNYVSASSMTPSKITKGNEGFECSKSDMPSLEALMPSSTPMLYSSSSFMTSSGQSNNRIPLAIIGNSASLHEDKSAAKLQLLPVAETGIIGSMPSSASEQLIPAPAFYTSSSGYRNIRFPDQCNVFATPASDLLCSVAKSPPESLQAPRRSDMVITDLPQPYPTNMTQLPTSINLPCSDVLPTSATSVWSDHFVQLSKDMVNAALVCQLSGKDHVYDKPSSQPSKPSSPSLLSAGQDLKDLKMTSSDVTPENTEAKSVAFGDNNRKTNKSTTLNKTNDRKRKISTTPLDASFDNKDDNSPPATSTPMTTSSSTTTSTITTNMNFVSGRNPKCDNMCPLCCRIFTRSWLLKGHMRTHTGERPYHCSHPHCDKAFADRSNLRSHMLIHSSHTRSFPCSKCGRTFSQKRYLHKHRIEVCKIREDNK